MVVTFAEMGLHYLVTHAETGLHPLEEEGEELARRPCGAELAAPPAQLDGARITSYSVLRLAPHLVCRLVSCAGKLACRDVEVA